MKKMVVRILKDLGCAVGVVLLLAAGYAAYLLLGYSRLPDMQILFPVGAGDEPLHAGESCRAATWNIGFAAYESDFSFFMDGGTESWADSPASVEANMEAIARELKKLDADIMLVQEVDADATRSYHIDERALLEADFPAYDALFAVNYDSDFLLYPLDEPHGKSLSGILTLTRENITEGLRVSLPVETGLTRFFDLDRCFSLARIPVDNGRELCLYNVHLSAYTQDPTIVDAQLEKLYASFAEEAQRGNYIVCGGDFNKDLTGCAEMLFDEESIEDSWAKPFPVEGLPEGISIPLAEGEGLHPTCRNADKPYDPETTYVTYVDGFLVSDNVRVESIRVEDQAFAYSDHQPVVLEFIPEP